MLAKITNVRGDILDYVGKCDYIIHGCNCYHTMGAGVAKVLNDFSGGRLLNADRKTPKGDINKLGTYSKVVGHKITIFNLYTQHGYGRDGVYIHWYSFRKGVTQILNTIPENSVVVMPPIGCGLAGGQRKDFDKYLKDAVSFSDKCHSSIEIIVVEK